VLVKVFIFKQLKFKFQMEKEKKAAHKEKLRIENENQNEAPGNEIQALETTPIMTASDNPDESTEIMTGSYVLQGENGFGVQEIASAFNSLQNLSDAELISIEAQYFEIELGGKYNVMFTGYSVSIPNKYEMKRIEEDCEKQKVERPVWDDANTPKLSSVCLMVECEKDGTPRNLSKVQKDFKITKENTTYRPFINSDVMILNTFNKLVEGKRFGTDPAKRKPLIIRISCRAKKEGDTGRQFKRIDFMTEFM